MNNVVSFADKKAESEPHESGTAFCLHCEHEWAAIRPLDMEEGCRDAMECPECGTHRGVFAGNYAPDEGALIFEHYCGCQFYRASKEGLFCIGCGETISYSELCD